MSIIKSKYSQGYLEADTVYNVTVKAVNITPTPQVSWETKDWLEVSFVTDDGISFSQNMFYNSHSENRPYGRLLRACDLFKKEDLSVNSEDLVGKAIKVTTTKGNQMKDKATGDYMDKWFAKVDDYWKLDDEIIIPKSEKKCDISENIGSW